MDNKKIPVENLIEKVDVSEIDELESTVTPACGGGCGGGC
ncbi:hypothetical protein CLHUN_04310 [Ruminiclostridium hungatei]|uniref:Thiazolylpeptide-type bacteriocin n=1 Tax=Ruminiclostridium hungatei TaxID=48256 RepID=A0A1V4SR86_RUMHU|nr:hypothetical protein CLHUN_04300 [Ruminiclostridium hungatei]OPX45956.1 hypothetical protein CLHUN_04310 [Ruminiclostridium hungatei]